MLLLSPTDIRHVFSMKDAIAADKLAFRLFSDGKTDVPLRTQIVSEKQNGTFLFMPAYAPDLDAAALKIINIFPNNIDKGLSSAPA
ncbi:MAG: ornithine cyclodeaminase family protein, partial [Enterococcus sp.]|nr:ornithine cyclodeaminase family protein [Enterococcus sp.]